MKQLLALAVWMSTHLVCLAQTTNVPVTTKPINTTVIKNVQIKGPDLTATITNITYNAGNYTIYYTLKNAGNVAVDLKNVELQGYVLDADNRFISGGGGVKLLYSGTLNGGQEYKGTLGCNDNNIYKNWNYKYVLKIDEKNLVAETNEENNTVEYPITGYKDAMASIDTSGIKKLQKTKTTTTPVQPPVQTPPPPAKPLPDLTITAASITKKGENIYEVQFTIKNIGAGDLEISSNGIRSNGRIIDNGLSYANTYFTSNFPRKTLKAGETHINQYTISPNMLNLLTKGVQYEYWITVDYISDIVEANENNNSFKINFRMGY